MRFNDILKLIEKEGNYLEWIYTTKSGIEYKCKIFRNKHMKNLCGYVILTSDNKFYNVDYNDIPVNVHGGLTFSNFYDGEYMIGFDCAHSGDLLPGLSSLVNSLLHSDEVYRDMEYVKSECESLAEQISDYSLLKIRLEKIDKLI